jgi:predicted cupin superfamily sugar epimerase
MTAEEIIAWLKLKPHPKEGGFFSETYRAGETRADWKRVAAQAVCEVERGDPLRLEGVKSQALTSRPPAFAECA